MAIVASSYEPQDVPCLFHANSHAYFLMEPFSILVRDIDVGDKKVGVHLPVTF